MGSFVRIYTLEPAELLASSLLMSRRNMTRAFDEAFGAYLRCHEILREINWESCPQIDDMLTLGDVEDEARDSYDVSARHYEAQVEDNLADWEASTVLLFGDDVLRTYARSLLGTPEGRLDGFGPWYSDITNSGRPVRFSRLLRAGTNALRHVSEWGEVPFPYPRPEDCPKWKRELENIDVINRAFGIAMHGRLTDPISMRVLIAVDRTLGDVDTKPSYIRFEGALVGAARDVAKEAGADAQARLEAALLTAGYAQELAQG